MATLSYLCQQLASHGLFDVRVKAIGDIHIDDHHTNEDVGLAIGTVSFLEQLYVLINVILGLHFFFGFGLTCLFEIQNS